MNTIETALQGSYDVTVNYDQSLEEMVTAGNYDNVHRDFTHDYIPVEGKGLNSLEVVLVHFNRRISTEDVIREMNTLGLRPANIGELLAFGAAYPEVQLERSNIVALGTVWTNSGNSKVVAGLEVFDGDRRLRSHWCDMDDWFPEECFAAVRK